MSKEMRKIGLLVFFIFQMLFEAKTQTTYYVSEFGNNSNTGLWGAPFRDVQAGLDACQPGDTLAIYGGSYYEFLNIPISDITIRREWPSDQVWINAPFGVEGEGLALMLIDGKSNIHIDGIIFSNHAANYAQGLYVRGNSDNVLIENCSFNNIHFSPLPNAAVNENTNAQPLIVEGTSEDPIENLVIRNCIIEDCRTGYSEGLAVNGNVDTFLIEGNTLDQLKNIGIVAIGHEGTCPNPVLDQARNGAIRENRVSSCLSQYATSGGIYVDGGRNITVERNYCNHNGYGIEIGCEHPGKSASDVVVKNNIIQDNEVAGLAVGGYDYPEVSGTVHNVLVRNNTFYKNDYLNDFTGEFLITHCNNLQLQSNIFFLNNQGVLGYSENDGGENTFEYNVIWNPIGDMELSWFGQNVSSFDELSSALGWNNAGIWGNPLFINVQQQNFRIQPNSPAKNYSYPSTIVDSDELDYYGNPRIIGILDCGAAEEGVVSSIKETTPNDYSVFPNPFNDHIFIHGVTERIYYSLFNTLGKEIKEGIVFGSEMIDLSGFPAGLYFLRLNSSVYNMMKQ